MQALHVIELLAGYDPNGKPIVEKLQVDVLEDNSCQLVRSPAFIKGLAGGDVIKLNKEDKQFEIQRRSGNLAIVVFSRGDINTLAEQLIPELEKLGGQLDTETERMLVFSIHVSCGFEKIEAILNQYVGRDGQSAWQYGNVYDPTDGTTPLNWWHEILKPQ
ncbi:DUF4265 domain-containing protein [Aurantivibrio plasticivorans]